MSLCVISGGHCCCQPEDGAPCPEVARLREEIRAATIEECARVCEEQGAAWVTTSAYKDASEYQEGAAKGAADCAAAIRALAKDKERQG